FASLEFFERKVNAGLAQRTQRTFDTAAPHHLLDVAEFNSDSAQQMKIRASGITEDAPLHDAQEVLVALLQAVQNRRPSLFQGDRFAEEFAQADSESAVHHEVRGETQSIPFVAPKPVSSRNASDDHNRWTGTPESMKVSKRDDYT